MLTFFSSPHILFFKNKEAQKASFYSLVLDCFQGPPEKKKGIIPD
jgi:hypothetical protein